MTNELILASAGSGKTYQLTNRYLALMARRLREGKEPAPENIIALTFTRKAAGEFFEEILKKLAKASRSEQAAAAIAGNPDDRENTLYHELKDLTPADYQSLLASFVKSSPRLFLGTLDSFFSSIVRSYPAELGLTGDFDILDEHQQTLTRQNLLRDVFTQADNEESREQLIQAFLLTAAGKEEATVARHLDQFITDHQELLHSAGKKGVWGQVKTIWPQGPSWAAKQGCYEEDFDELFASFGDTLTPKQRETWEEFRDQLPAHHPGTPLKDRPKTLLPKIRAVWSDILNGEASITVNRKQVLGADSCAALVRIISRFLKAEFEVRLVRTQGIWSILNLYEKTYNARVRQQGHLTFADLPLLLAGSTSRQAPVLTQREGDDERLRIDYRLDAKYFHWLLDEFQDTSWQQWSAISNLVDEVLQDDTQERSLFMVGDTKQAIYAWRGGDSRLFNDIHRQYKHTLKERGLNVSWRSSPAVIEPVNRIFGDRSALGRVGLSPRVVERWNWPTHQVAAPHQQRAGFTAYYHPEKSIEKPEKEDLHRIVLAILEEARPVERGLSCAILVQQNKDAIPLVDYIRQHSDIPIVSESDSSIITDNPITLAFLSLFRLAAHPHDDFALGHLHLTPLRALLGDRSPGSVGADVRAGIHYDGFETTLRRWVEAAGEANLSFDPFSRQRIEQFLLAARQFDSTGERSLDRFLAFAESYTLREESSRATVQVMTVHKSKGLTFDMVILPELKGKALTFPRGNGLAIKRDPVSRHVQWVLDQPSRDIAELDPVFQQLRQENEDDAAYEQLCKFYVALTRAKYANYLVSTSYSGSSQNFLKLLNETLCQGEAEESRVGDLEVQLAFAEGQAQWWNELNLSAPAEPEAPPRDPVPTLAGRPRLPRRTPSDHGEQAVPPSRLFSRKDNRARELGNEVHDLFESIDWFVPGKPPALTSTSSEALAHLQAVLSDPACQEALAKPAQPARLWREQNFELLLDGHWVSGTIDRATILLDEQDQPVAARIIDYKTDKVANEAEALMRSEHYRSQLAIYRRACALLLGIDEDTITTALIFTRLPLFLEIELSDSP
ncbi:MAG: UvrD-helicase domain-containing protein [Verrucomicrobiota bacterium JB023]|nr:UvrD-helicase domain-containing protein [Verrucomicrobiota bacterium JB023]